MMNLLPGHRDHPRTLPGSRFVYAVLSRRSRGISVGINLCPDQACNFACAYCQVDRQAGLAGTLCVEPMVVRAELTRVLEQIATGALFDSPRFAGVPTELRVLKDIAFSGDGEPTAVPAFPTVLADVLALHRTLGPADVPVVVLTNASLLDRAPIRQALEQLRRSGGQLWAKLDAGTAEQFARLNRSAVPYARILENLRATARWFPLTVQSMFLAWEGQRPSDQQIAAYVERLGEIVAAGGTIRLVQVYTVARPPADARVSAVSPAVLREIGERVERQVGVPVECFGG